MIDSLNSELKKYRDIKLNTISFSNISKQDNKNLNIDLNSL